jgi:arabinofuranan 3-O-arabinosyltransferase
MKSLHSNRLLAALAALAYLPLLWSSPGLVSADTKTYLYLDPSKLLARAPYLWDEHIGFGTVTHQNIGYLFPMGPYYWLMDHLGVPDWIAQRLWLGTLLFAAGAGTVYLCRTLGWTGRGVGVAAVAYMLSPYIFDYAARLSAILLPWAGLGWLLSFTIRSVREGGWRWPARFAFTVAAVGGVNATSLVLVGLAPVWWIIHALATRAVRPMVATRAVVRIGVLTVPVSLWWMAGLMLQGRYGIPILRYTETYEAVSRASTVPEVLRGLGYWFFYGSDRVAPWVTAGRPYTQTLWLLLSSFGIVALGLLAAATVRWRERGFAVGLLVIGVVVSAGAHPYHDPTLFGRGFKGFIESAAGMALRSTPRAVPLISLALALFFGVGARALADRFARLSTRAPQAAVTLLLANVPTFLFGHIYTPSLLRNETVPTYWTDAAKALDTNSSTRVLETPGSDFADYRWGGTIDPITPGLMDRPYVARELIPYGSAASADLLNAYERRQQDGLLEPKAVAPLARLMAVGDIALRSDLQFERYRVARPRQLWDEYSSVGLDAPTAFGSSQPNLPIARLPLKDEVELTASPTLADPPAVATFGVPNAQPIVRTSSLQTTVVDGDGEGLYDAAASGLLTPTSAVLYAGDLAARPNALENIAANAPLIVTDQNRRQARSWGSVRENLGHTEQVGETAMRRDANDNRLDLFPDASDDFSTVVQQRGVARAQATGYGNPITYTPEDRAANAFDGDPLTAWRVGAFADVTGEKLEVQLTVPTTTDHISLQQPTWGAQNRWLTQVELRFDAKDPLLVDLSDESRQPPGQTVSFPSRTFTTLTITLVATNFTKLPGYRGLVAVGFAEVDIPGVKVDEVIRPPVDLLARSKGHPLDVVFTRQRANQIEPNRSDPELSITRTFTLPSERSFTLTGEARVSGLATDDVEQKVTGARGATAVATASIVGAPLVRAASAIDSDTTTAWTTPIDKWQQTITVTNPSAVTTTHLDLSVVNDGRHSLPTVISLTVDGGPGQTLSLPAWPAATSTLQAVSMVTVQLPSPVTGTRFGVSLVEAQVVSSIDYLSERPVALPIGIAEIGLTGLQSLQRPDQFSNDCRTDLVTVDGSPVAVRLTGSMTDGLLRRPLSLDACTAVPMAAGEHVIRTVIGRDVGIDVDRLLLRSPLPHTPDDAAPTVTMNGHGPVSYDLTVGATTKPFWLVLSQSHNPGWEPTVQGGSAGPLTIVNGFANGWLITPDASGKPVHVSLDWVPQRIVWLALLLSALALVVVLFLGWRPTSGGSVVVGCRDTTSNDIKATFDRPSQPAPLVWPVVGAFAFAAFGGVSIGVATLAVGVLAARLPRSRRILVWVPPALIGFIAVYGYAKTARYHLPTDLEWPGAFGPAHQLGWLAVALTAVLALTAKSDDRTSLRRDPVTTRGRPGPWIQAVVASS